QRQPISTPFPYTTLFRSYQSKRDMFVGVYSYFSKEHLTYLTLIADEDTTVAYIDQSAREGQAEVFARDFLPVMVHELYLRQMLKIGRATSELQSRENLVC